MGTITARVTPEQALRWLNAIATAGLWVGIIALTLHAAGFVEGGMAQIGALTIGSLLTMVATEEAEPVIRRGSVFDDDEPDGEEL